MLCQWESLLWQVTIWVLWLQNSTRTNMVERYQSERQTEFSSSCKRYFCISLTFQIPVANATKCYVELIQCVMDGYLDKSTFKNWKLWYNTFLCGIGEVAILNKAEGYFYYMQCVHVHWVECSCTDSLSNSSTKLCTKEWLLFALPSWISRLWAAY